MEKLKEKTEPMTPGQAAPISELAKEGQRVYSSQLRNTLEPQHVGEFVAIHPETGAYFLGATGTEALSKAHAAMPTAQFYLEKVGSEAAHKMRAESLRKWVSNGDQ